MPYVLCVHVINAHLIKKKDKNSYHTVSILYFEGVAIEFIGHYQSTHICVWCIITVPTK